jgi:hypothetical protein
MLNFGGPSALLRNSCEQGHLLSMSVIAIFRQSPHPLQC